VSELLVLLIALWIILRFRKVQCKTCFKFKPRYKMVSRETVSDYPFNIYIYRCRDPNPFAVGESFAPCKYIYEKN
jgi:hypothetical protein